MYLNTLLEGSISDQNQFVEIECTSSVYRGRVMTASLEGEMFGFVQHPSGNSVYISKDSVLSIRFVAEEDLPQPGIELLEE